MLKWFNKEKDNKIEKADEVTESTKVNNVDNYKTKENGDIKITVEEQYIGGYYFPHKDDMTISKSLIISHTKNNIVFKSYKYHFNFELEYLWSSCDYQSIENKSNLIRYKDTLINTYEYFTKDKCWKCIKTDVVGTEVVSDKTPLEIFKEAFKSKYKLIETEDEFNEYIASAFDCDTWCRKKLYDKMKELGLGDGFINQFADLVGNDLDKYYAMIDLANEVSDKDTLMYLYTYKFRQN